MTLLEKDNKGFVHKMLPRTLEEVCKPENHEIFKRNSLLTKEFLLPTLLETDPNQFLDIVGAKELRHMISYRNFRGIDFTSLINKNLPLQYDLGCMALGRSHFNVEDETILHILTTVNPNLQRIISPSRDWYPFKKETVRSYRFKEIYKKLEKTKYYSPGWFLLDAYIDNSSLNLARMNKKQVATYVEAVTEITASHFRKWLLSANGLDYAFLDNAFNSVANYEVFIKICIHSEDSSERLKQLAIQHLSDKKLITTLPTERFVPYIRTKKEFLSYIENPELVNIEVLAEGMLKFNEIILPSGFTQRNYWAVECLEHVGAHHTNTVNLSEHHSDELNFYIAALNISQVSSKSIQKVFVEELAAGFPDLFYGINNLSDLPLSRLLEIIKMELMQ